MPVYYNEDDDENRRRQNGNPNYGTNANFRNYREPTRATSDTEASSTGNHIGDLYRRHRMNQAEAQNDARQSWFQNAREQQTRDQGNNVFDRINRLNEHNPTHNRGDQYNQGQRGQGPQYHREAAPQNLGASLGSGSSPDPAPATVNVATAATASEKLERQSLSGACRP
jgi:hypothetical protein